MPSPCWWVDRAAWSGGRRSEEERPVVLEDDPQPFGVDVVVLAPLGLEGVVVAHEDLGAVLHDLGDQAVGAMDRLARFVDEAGLDGDPALLLGAGVAEERPPLRRRRGCVP
jgi:hypothetical protein